MVIVWAKTKYKTEEISKAWCTYNILFIHILLWKNKHFTSLWCIVYGMDVKLI